VLGIEGISAAWHVDFWLCGPQTKEKDVIPCNTGYSHLPSISGENMGTPFVVTQGNSLA